MINDSSIIENFVKRDRLIVISGLVLVVALSWIYILYGAGMNMTIVEMMAKTDSGPSFLMQPAIWTTSYALLMFFMWWVMMIAMMIPSASPMILLFAAINRNQRKEGNPFVSTGIFAFAYIIAWGGFSLLATGLQWSLEQVGLMSAVMVSTDRLFSGLVIIAAGIYQLSPQKHAFLNQCRTPFQFIANHWEKGSSGALRMGIKHGFYCLGCCWTVMALLFVGGIMNLFWIAGLAVYVLLEKTIPEGHRLGSLGGIGLIGWGIWVLSMAP